MEVIYTIEQLRSYLDQTNKRSIGLVPTMGYLHDGHLSLVHAARQKNDLVVMSIFVNPLQFGPNEDYDRYPRDEQKDLHHAEQAGVDVVFMPSVHEMYPEKMGIDVKVIEGTDVLCGRSRQGHFDGVATVLSKLFHIVRPSKAYFGLKDAQQFAIVHTLIKSLNFPISLIGLETVREKDGLAISSRNVYLSQQEREEAAFLNKGLQFAKELIHETPLFITEKIKTFLKENTPHASIDYIALLSYPHLRAIQIIDEPFIVAAAIQYEQARLIDNIILTPEGTEIRKISSSFKDKRVQWNE